MLPFVPTKNTSAASAVSRRAIPRPPETTRPAFKRTPAEPVNVPLTVITSEEALPNIVVPLTIKSPDKVRFGAFNVLTNMLEADIAEAVMTKLEPDNKPADVNEVFPISILLEAVRIVPVSA